MHVPGLGASLDEPGDASIHSDGQYIAGLEEWISLVCLGSPRVVAGDNPNPFICRYDLPVHEGGGANGQETAAESNVTDVVHLRWRGFVPAPFALQVMLAAKRMSKGHFWALSTKSFRDEHDTVTVLGLPEVVKGEMHYLCWHWPG